MLFKKDRKNNLVFCLAMGGMLVAESVGAMPFGSFDPRSLAMGGTGVASADANNAVFHNPALLAQYQYDEDEGRHSAYIFPTMTARVSDTVEEVATFREQDYDGQLEQAITAFNNTANNATEQAVLDAALNLQDGLSRVSGGPVVADGNVAFVIAIPSHNQGGAFLFNKRYVGDGRINKTAEDEALLNLYIETMQFLTGQTATPPPNIGDIYDGNQLTDVTGNLTSTASAAGIALTELAVAMGGQFTVFKQKLYLGITPKFVKAETYATETTATDNYDRNQAKSRWDITADVGLAKKFSNGWNVGLTIKNARPLEYSTNTSGSISIGPQVRTGVAYNSRWGQVSLDMDVLENDSVGSGDKTQYALLGGEWDFRWGKLRGGYNYNFSATSAVKKGLYSAGIRLSPLGMILDFAYAQNEVERAAALQMGFQF